MPLLIAKKLDQVMSVLKFAEDEARAGSHVVVMLSYEAAPAFDSALVAHEPSEFPLAWAALLEDAGGGKPPFLTCNNPVVTSPSSESGREACLRDVNWSPLVERDEYDRAVARIRELIAAGDTYQVNYSFPLTSSFTGDAYELYRNLFLAQGAPYSAYLDLGRFKVLCLSPELFFERRGNHVVTRPMKGTIKRGRCLEEDRELAQQLAASAKDRAENVMIVDLLRNDLGKVAVPGSVRVTSLFDVERFETVWQMTSTVEATLQDGTSLIDLMTALFPCGSVTGAPKIRTMQIIRELERFPRGAYTGTIGFLKPGGDCIFNVAIRTVVIDTETNVATFGVGGGVTIDSTAEREYEECLVKSRFLHATPVEFQLFESLLLEDGEYFLVERHIERLRDSAEFFGFTFQEDEIRSALEHIAANGKVRLTLWKDGRIETEVSSIEPSGVRRVTLAPEPVDSSDRFLFHKTTNRLDGSDIIFWNERGEITESTIANVVVRIAGELWTPPVESGLLAGTFRNQLLAEGKIKERVITIEELKNAGEFFLINSVRKWMKAHLTGCT